MKKIFLLTVLLVLSVFMCSCSERRSHSGNNTVTAVAVYSNGDFWDYNFFVSGGRSEAAKEEGENKNLKMYKVSAKNFEEGINKFEEKFGTVNTGHLCDIFIDKLYLENNLKNDILLIKNRISVSPLVSFCVTDSNDFNIFNIIEKNYEGNFQSFTKKFFSGKRKSGICTLTEIYLAYCDKRYNASLPYLSVDKDNMLTDNSVVIYTSYGKSAILSHNDANIYQKYIDKYSKTSNGFDVRADKKDFSVRFKGDIEDVNDFKSLCKKYSKSDFDIFNIKYYAKKCFITMDNYEKFLDTAPKIVFE